MNDYIKREDAIVAYANHEVDARQGKFDDYHQYMRNVLRSVESVDVAPVRHGEWIDDGRGFHCSSCGRYETEQGTYCRLCGAIMDGENDEID